MIPESKDQKADAGIAHSWLPSGTFIVNIVQPIKLFFNQISQTIKKVIVTDSKTYSTGRPVFL